MTIENGKMDDLEFRRTIYADPNCDDIRVKEAAAQDPAKQEFWSEQKKIDAGSPSVSSITSVRGWREFYRMAATKLH